MATVTEREALKLIGDLLTDAGASLSEREATIARIVAKALGMEIIIVPPRRFGR